METITEFLDHLYKWPKDRIAGPEEDQEQFLVHWGYTIYRTYYGPGSDGQWLKLLKNITDGVGKGLTELEEADKEPAAVTKARDQFQLDAPVLDFYDWMDRFTWEQIVNQAWPEKLWDPYEHK
ncbi:unnamed protein product [Alternaria sp. RS040]